MRWEIRHGGASRSLRVALAFLGLTYAFVVHAAEPCVPALGRVVSSQGVVEVSRAGAAFVPAPIDTVLCAGDALRVQSRSRAALLLPDETTLRLDQGTLLILASPDAENAAVLQQPSGGVHVITRTRRPFRIRTPFINANVEGTEFEVRVGSAAAEVAVYEGDVLAANEFGEVVLASGEHAIATRGAAPQKTTDIRPIDAVAWKLYFPTVFDYRIAIPDAADAAFARSVAAYREGRLNEALTILDAAPAPPSAARLIYRAGLLLLVGRLDEAKPDIAAARRLDPGSSDASALESIIALVENDKDRALQLAREAVARDSASPAALIALSYAQQARFDISAALSSVGVAIGLAPGSGLAHARRAELEMSLGLLDEALASARKAVALDANRSRARTVLGFANLTRLDTAAARASFNEAIGIDQADPLPRLGLGLTKIRDGDLEGGRIEIEIAAILDPLDSLIRSYLGKAYYEERRDVLAGGQFDLARRLDPRDPTPYFYDAVRKQASNRPVEALLDLQRSIALNDNRAVYRSRLLIDDDRAARTTSLAAVYAELGFERLAIVESVKALADNLGNDAAHRQLASAYVDQPRHDIARVSEALQGQIRQPLTLSPIEPQLSTDNLGILRGSGPARLGANEYNLLFASDRIRLQGDGIVGSRNTLGDQLVFSGVNGNVAYSASQLHYETQGFGGNDSARKNATQLFVQGQLAPALSVQGEVRYSDFALGQTFFAFDPASALAARIKEHGTVGRISGHFEVDPGSDWIVSVSGETRTRLGETVPDSIPITEIHTRSRSYSVQYLRRSETLQWVFGAESLRQQDDQPIESAEMSEHSAVVYGYGLWRVVPGKLSIEGGLAFERLEVRSSFFDAPIDRRRVSPKLGVVWTPTATTTLRLATFSAVKRPFIASQTLEPTQVAGFNQFFTGFNILYGDLDGTVSKRAAVGLDQRFGERLFAGIELSGRNLDVPDLATVRDYRWKERTAHAYLYYVSEPGGVDGPMAGWTWAASLEYDLEKLERPADLTGAEGFLDVKTQRVPIGLRLFRGNLAFRLAPTFVKQNGLFSAGAFSDIFPKSSSGWLVDAAVEYHLPRRYGTVSIGARNLFDKRTDVFQSDPFSPRDANARLVYAKLRVVF